MNLYKNFYFDLLLKKIIIKWIIIYYAINININKYYVIINKFLFFFSFKSKFYILS